MRYEGIGNADVVVGAAPDRQSLREGEALAQKRFIARLHDAKHGFVRQYFTRLYFLPQGLGVFKHRLCQACDKTKEQQQDAVLKSYAQNAQQKI